MSDYLYGKSYIVLKHLYYLIQFIQRKVDEAKGIQVTDKTQELQEKIEVKESELSQKEKQLEIVSQSVKKLVDDLRLVEKI